MQFALFRLGFRPFYLLAAGLAALAVPAWALGRADLLWHAHEMVFGFAVAVITGFLFTAARNWTGLETPSGALLAGFALLWLAGRVLLAVDAGLPAAIVDSLFLPAVAIALAVPLFRARNRNRFFVGLLLLFALLNIAFHAGWRPLAMLEAALGLVVVIVTIMGGRVIPAFTANAIPTARVRRFDWLDRTSIAAAALAIVAHLTGVGVAPIAFVAALLNAARLVLWDPLATRGVPILWILHLSYAWIPLGLVLLAAGHASPALHAFAVGAVGGMVIGMMTRTARGHTGRPLHAGPAEVAAYALAQLAAVVRVLIPLIWPAGHSTAIIVSATLWSAAFAIYVIVYAPILTRARVDGKPG